MGQPHYGTEAEFLLLCSKYNEFLALRAINKTGLLWPPFFKEYFEEFPFEEFELDGKIMTLEKRKEIQRWFRNHANRGTRLEDIKYIPPKHLKPPKKVPVKQPKQPKESSVDKAFKKALYGTTRKYTMPLRQAYAELHEEEIAEPIKKAWEQEKKNIIASNGEVAKLSQKERNIYLSQQFPKFRVGFLTELLDVATEVELERCEKYRMEKSEEDNTKEEDIQEAQDRVSKVIRKFLKNMTKETGYSFYLVGGGQTVCYKGGLSLFEVESSAFPDAISYRDWEDTSAVTDSYMEWSQTTIPGYKEKSEEEEKEASTSTKRVERDSSVVAANDADVEEASLSQKAKGLLKERVTATATNEAIREDAASVNPVEAAQKEKGKARATDLTRRDTTAAIGEQIFTETDEDNVINEDEIFTSPIKTYNAARKAYDDSSEAPSSPTLSVLGLEGNAEANIDDGGFGDDGGIGLEDLESGDKNDADEGGDSNRAAFINEETERHEVAEKGSDGPVLRKPRIRHSKSVVANSNTSEDDVEDQSLSQDLNSKLFLSSEPSEEPVPIRAHTPPAAEWPIGLVDIGSYPRTPERQQTRETPSPQISIHTPLVDFLSLPTLANPLDSPDSPIPETEKNTSVTVTLTRPQTPPSPLTPLTESSRHEGFPSQSSSFSDAFDEYGETLNKRGPHAYINKGMVFLIKAFRGRSLAAVENWVTFEDLNGFVMLNGEIGGQELMPPELKKFCKDLSYSGIEIPKDSIAYGKVYRGFWRFLQPDWRFLVSNTIKKTENTLYNDHNFLPPDETWPKLMVSGVRGILIALVGAAIWSMSAKEDKRARNNGEEITKTIKDINIVIEMMTRNILNRKEKEKEVAKKRGSVEPDSDEMDESNARAAKKVKSKR